MEAETIAPSTFRISPRRPLGRTGFEATRIGVGDLADRKLSLAQCVATLRRALDTGMNVVDTAPMYEEGYSEEIVGRAIKGRDGIFLIDKIDHFDRAVGPQVGESLRRLEREAVDLFVFHNVSKSEDWRTVIARGGRMDELREEVRAGRVRFRGISSHHPDVLRAALESGACDVVMFPVGPFVDRRYLTEILPLAKARGVGTVCFKAYGAGKLLGDTEGYNQPLKQRPRGKISSGGVSGDAVLPRLGVDECLHYTLTFDPDVTLLGMSFPNEQDATFEAFSRFAPLTEAQLEQVRQRAEEAVKDKGRVWWNPSP